MADDSTDIQRQALERLEQLLDSSATERARHLAEARVSDPALHAELTRLLAAREYANAAIRTGFAATMAADFAPPDRVGPYRIDGLIGRGGMGVVYRGERDDGAFERTVAVKFVEGAIDSGEARARFSNERAILARMSHPNIATLLDGGDYQGRPYLVMEYVQGEPFRHDPERLLARTLSAFVKVCSAVAYAHNNLVLHRDLKPSNMLLGDDGEPTLLDFGIAKLTDTLVQEDAEDLTAPARAPMTVNYSAPERLAGEPATVASEIYALGICLYELVNGSRPYDLSTLSLVKAHEQLSQQPVQSRSGALDLDRIIETATRLDPAQRYPTVQALQQDLERFLAGEPVAARGDDWRYLLRRVLHRYRALLLVGAGGVVALLAGLGFAFWGYMRAEEQALIAAQEASTNQATLGFLTELLTSANPWDGEAQNSTVAELLANASATLDDAYQDNPRVRGYILTTLTDVYIGRGEFDAALASANEAVALLEAQPQALAPYAGLILRAQGSALQETGDSAAAAAALEQAIARFKAAPAVDWEAVATTLNRLGTIRIEQNDEGSAEQTLLRALALHETHALNNPSARSSILNNLSSLYNLQGRLEDAARYLELTRQELGRFDASAALRGINVGNLAGVLTKLKRFDEAEQFYLEALALQRSMLTDDHPEILVLKSSLAYLYIISGQPQQAVTVMTPALTAVEPLPDEHQIRAYVENIAGLSLCEAGDAERGLPLTERSLAARESLFPAGHWLIYSAASVVGRCATLAGDLARAGALLRAAAPALVEMRGADDEVAGVALQRLAQLEALEQRSH